MNKNTVLLLVIFLLPLIAYFYVSHSSKSIATIPSSNARIIKFTSNMCGECKRVDAVIKEVYPKYQNKISLTSIAVQDNTKYNNEMTAKYKVTLVPTIILLDKNNNIIKRIEGCINAETFDKYLKELCND